MNFDAVAPWDPEKKLLNVIIDTPKDSRNKYKFDEDLGIFKLSGTLALGHSFPFDFGSIPQTKGDDDDALDVLILMDEAAFTGCLVECRLIGGLKAYQTDDGGKRERNDRLLAIAEKSILYKEIKTLDDLDPALLNQVAHFFISYNAAKGKQFKVEKRFGPDEAANIVNKAIDPKRAHA